MLLSDRPFVYDYTLASGEICESSIYIYICIYVHHVYIYIYVSVYTYIYICVYIYVMSDVGVIHIADDIVNTYEYIYIYIPSGVADCVALFANTEWQIIKYQSCV